LSDPSKVEGDSFEQARAFLACISEISAGVEQRRNIAKQGLAKKELAIALAAIGNGIKMAE
jgi:hypothetical protein